MQTQPASTEIYIRIPETGGDFIYTIKRDGEILRSAVVFVVAPSPENGDVFHGGSEVID